MMRGTDKVGGSRHKREAPVAEWRGILTRVNPEGLRALKMLAIEARPNAPATH